MLNTLDFNRMKVFYFVYQSKNLSIAAKQLNVTRSAVSQVISKLEKDLKIQLFERTNKNLVSTEWADQLFVHIEKFTNSLTNTLELFEKGKTEKIGHLRIGAPPEFGSNHLVEVIAAFTRRHPLVTFDIQFGTPDPLCKKVTQRKLDLAFVDAANVFTKLYPLESKIIMKEEEVLCCSKSYFDKHKPSAKNPEKLASLDFISHVQEALDIKFWFKHHLKKVPEKVRVVLVAEEVRALRRATIEGMGISFMPLRLVHEELKNKKLVAVETTGSNYENNIAMTWPAEKNLPPLTRFFMETYLAEFAQVKG